MTLGNIVEILIDYQSLARVINCDDGYFISSCKIGISCLQAKILDMIKWCIYKS